MSRVIDTQVATIAADHQRMVRRALDLLRAADDPWNMADLAEESGLSPFYFSRIFRDVTGIPPNEFQTAIRFERAKSLLLHTQAPVTDICYDVGYGSLGTFSSRFSRLVGVSPAEFRHLPERISGIDFRTEIVNPHQPAHQRGAVIEGVAHLPADFQGQIFIGIYPSSLPAASPIAGLMLPRPGAFELPGIPVGGWVLLGCAFRTSNEPIEQLLPSRGMLVAGGGTIRVVNSNEHHLRTLKFRELDPLEPPILTALTGLLLK